MDTDESLGHGLIVTECMCEACVQARLDCFVGRLYREREEAEAALSRRDRFRRSLRRWRPLHVWAAEDAYRHDRIRWWHGGQTPGQRMTLSLFPAVIWAKGAFALLGRSGRAV